MKPIEALRSALIPVLTEGSWERIEADHRKVQLSWRTDLEPGWGKPRYVEKVLADLPEEELVALGERCVDVFPDRAAVTVQNALWRVEQGDLPGISEITRLAVADGLDGRVMHPHEEPETFLQRFGVRSGDVLDLRSAVYGSDGLLYAEELGDVLAIFGRTSSSAEVRRAQYTHRELLDSYGFRAWPEKRVIQFLEALVHPTVRTGQEQQEWVSFINRIISADGFQLDEAERLSGYPLFEIRRRDHGVGGRPKNLIFASTGPKPELGFRDAVNNDIVVLKHAEHCLIYEEKIGDDGLLWDDLVAWWARLQDRDSQAADIRRGLGLRLQASLGSDAERQLFDTYFRRFRPLLDSRLPALIPQVYLHYDPITFRQLRARGEGKRFLAQRMDFLLLLPERVRIVLEVDGRQHYSEGDGTSARPSPRKYAETTAADRTLRLAGYEVYRFSGFELQEADRAANTVVEFFGALFRRHGILT